MKLQRKVDWNEARQIMLKGGLCRFETFTEGCYAEYLHGMYWYNQGDQFPNSAARRPLAFEDEFFTGTWIVVKEPPEPVPPCEDRLKEAVRLMHEMHNMLIVMNLELYKQDSPLPSYYQVQQFLEHEDDIKEADDERS